MSVKDRGVAKIVVNTLRTLNFSVLRGVDIPTIPCSPAGSTKGGNETFDRTTGREGQLTLQRHREPGTVDKRCRICNGDELCAMFAGERRAFFMMQGEGRRISRAKNRVRRVSLVTIEALLSV
jgi:hypothetical protein